MWSRKQYSISSNNNNIRLRNTLIGSQQPISDSVLVLFFFSKLKSEYDRLNNPDSTTSLIFPQNLALASPDKGRQSTYSAE